MERRPVFRFFGREVIGMKSPDMAFAISHPEQLIAIKHVEGFATHFAALGHNMIILRFKVWHIDMDHLGDRAIGILGGMAVGFQSAVANSMMH